MNKQLNTSYKQGNNIWRLLLPKCEEIRLKLAVDSNVQYTESFENITAHIMGSSASASQWTKG
jgi:hypothetical protein